MKLDLFDRRAAVYEAARDFLLSIGTSGRVTQEAEFAFRSGIRGARWLFDADLVTYLEEAIWEKAVDLGVLNSELPGLEGDERKRNVHAQRDLKNELSDQLKILEEKVAPYLELRH